MAEYEVSIILRRRYPRREPKVFEVGGRIRRISDGHVNRDGDCCVTVWEHWLVAAGDHSFAAFLNGPVDEYFLGQHRFEKTGKWPFGERSHGKTGSEEAFAETLGVSLDKDDLHYYLRLLMQNCRKVTGFVVTAAGGFSATVIATR
jgi:hypothetical protein